MSAPGPPSLQVTVVTADIKGAGTDGSVTITIEGEKGSAKDLTLSNDYSANFERGHTDVFDVTAPDVGVIKSVTVKLVSGCTCLYLLAVGTPLPAYQSFMLLDRNKES
jgi:hypothetical protein